MKELQSYKKNQIREYSRFRLTLFGDKNYMEISEDDRRRIVEAIISGVKYISLGNIFFASSSLSSILPISDVTDEVVYQPNRLLEAGE